MQACTWAEPGQPPGDTAPRPAVRPAVADRRSLGPYAPASCRTVWRRLSGRHAHRARPGGHPVTAGSRTGPRVGWRNRTVPPCGVEQRSTRFLTVAGRIVGAMGKATRPKRHRRAAPRRKLVVVDACEVGAYNGMVSLRVGGETPPPLCLAIPPSPELAGHLRSSSLDAEEQYWQVLPAVVKGITPGDKAAPIAAMQSWLLGKDWAGLVRQIPADGGLASLAIVSSWGHVGLVADPPYARAPVLAIDPMQLRRLAPSFQSALAAAGASRPGPPAILAGRRGGGARLPEGAAVAAAGNGIPGADARRGRRRATRLVPGLPRPRGLHSARGAQPLRVVTRQKGGLQVPSDNDMVGPGAQETNAQNAITGGRVDAAGVYAILALASAVNRLAAAEAIAAAQT